MYEASEHDPNRELAQLVNSEREVGKSRWTADRLNRFETEKGVKLHINKIKAAVLQAALKTIERPQVPQIRDEDSDRWLENPSDPDYLDRVDQYNSDRNIMVMNMALGLGTRVESVPEGVDGIESESWVEELAFANIEVPDVEHKLARKVAWLKFYVLENDEIQALLTQVNRYSGLIPEEDVEEKIETFPSDEERSSDPGTRLNGASPNWDNDIAPD